MRYFMADPHFGHDNHNGGIIKMMARVSSRSRLFASIEEHDEHILAEINKRVGPQDELVIGGDFAWDKPGKYRMKMVVKHVRFVMGNHDRVQQCTNVFGNVTNILHTTAFNKQGNDKIKIVVTHYPNAFWDGSHKGWGHLYGHMHGQHEETLDMLFPERRAFDIGVDNIYRIWGYYGPISEVDVYDYLARRAGHDDIRYYKDFQIGLYLRHGLVPPPDLFAHHEGENENPLEG